MKGVFLVALSFGWGVVLAKVGMRFRWRWWWGIGPLLLGSAAIVRLTDALFP